MYTIYKITNSQNGRCYIGATTKTAAHRFREHINKASRDIPHCKFHVAIREFGADAFTLEALEIAETQEEATKLEAKHIFAFDSYHNGYNSNLWGGPADAKAAENFGEFLAKGKANPLAKSFLIRFPDGTENVITGLRSFCRENDVSGAHLKMRGHSKGYVLLKRFNDQRASA